MTRRPRYARVALRLVLATLACLAGLASPATAVLHGLAHAREHEQAHVLVRRTDAHETKSNASSGAIAPATRAYPAASLDVADDDHDHPALHAQLVAKPRVDLAAALLARAPPALPVLVAIVNATRPTACGARTRSAPPRSYTQPRAPPLG